MLHDWNKILPFLTIIFFVTVTAFAVDKASVAILPLTNIGDSVTEANAVTNLLEIAFINSGSFIVIEQKDISKV